MIEENVKRILNELSAGNAFGEKITLVAATKTRSPEEINRAIAAGITDTGENRVQEFTEKYDLLSPCRRHFIGHLQTNKVKYLIGKVDLYHSLDRDELAEELDKRSQRAGIVSDVLVQINIGNEETKGGYPLAESQGVYSRLAEKKGLRIRGLMAMLPVSDDEHYLATLCDQMRALFETLRKNDPNVCYLSMGMSGDYRLCVKHGANTVRLGSCIFGKRSYLEQQS